VISLLAVRNGIETHPLFIDYGQLCVEPEWSACLYVHRKHKLPTPVRMGLGGFGKTIPSGLTDSSKDLVREAFLPCRNLLFTICGASYAYSRNVDCVALGLLAESEAIFPDQTRVFLERAEEAVHAATGRAIRVVAPLLAINKAAVLAIAKKLGVAGTYSCHRGTAVPCGQCISCLERIRASKLTS